MARVRLSLKTSPQGVAWETLRDTWALAGEMAVFDGLWMNDHLTDMSASAGPSLEALTLAATLVHLVPGKWVGHAVLSNTFRHPAVLAKAATVMDHATGGHFILGLGAGWHAGEHAAFGLALPPIGERIDRLESAVAVLQALFSSAAATPPGVTRADPFYPLHDAMNLPAPRTPGGPPIYLGGQKRRGIALAARAAAGWLQPGTDAGDVPYFSEHRTLVLRAMEAIGRDPTGFAFAGQVHAGRSPTDRRQALGFARGLVEAGATEVVLGMRAGDGPEGLRRLVRDVAEPLRDTTG
ncbi:MAG TPA: LLM class flavin-dependent oxidoreductase [Candidatus Sulfotelmatobacter sp.]|nr:LLM class flavin-dependent oxidoreductase [Candidatus Sulfotelmatobacter sp.]